MAKSHYIIPIFVPHEGCPHDCVFCNQNSITGTSTTVDSVYVDKIVNEYLETITAEDAIIEISFFGGTFTAIQMDKQVELLTVAKKYKENKKISFIRLSTRPDYIDDIILTNLKEYSVDIIELGVQSLDEEVLLKSGRGHTAEDVVKASKLIKQYGFVLGHQLMIGLPGDSIQKDIETAKRSIELKPEICRIYPALIIKDTHMETMYLEKKFNPYSLNEAVNISKAIYIMMIANQINVIRIGLQPTEEISEGKDLIAGPFHPAFRELVEGGLYNDMIYDVIINNINQGLYINNVLLKINPKDISKLYAKSKEFFNAMKKQINGVSIDVFQDIDIERGSINAYIGEKCISINVYGYACRKYKDEV